MTCYFLVAATELQIIRDRSNLTLPRGLLLLLKVFLQKRSFCLLDGTRAWLELFSPSDRLQHFFALISEQQVLFKSLFNPERSGYCFGLLFDHDAWTCVLEVVQSKLKINLPARVALLVQLVLGSSHECEVCLCVEELVYLDHAVILLIPIEISNRF